MVAKIPKKMGRPPKIVDDEKTLQTLSGLAKIQCTTKEASAVLGVSEPTFIDFLKRSLKAREAWDNSQQSGRASLRRMQFASADRGNTTMLVWLGKQYLNQKDKHEQIFEAGESFKDVWSALSAGGFAA